MAYNILKESNKLDKIGVFIMKVGYLRVSSKTQLLDRQELLMEQSDIDKIYMEKVSGKNTDRPELKAMMEFVREGDVVVVESISRFARNTRDLLTLVEELEKKGVGFVSLKENIDTTTTAGKFMLTIFGAMAELERSYILDRQKEGIAAMPVNEKGKKVSARNGVPTGRPERALPKNFDKIYKQYKTKELNVKQICKLYDIPRSSFYMLKKRYEEQIK